MRYKRHLIGPRFGLLYLGRQPQQPRLIGKTAIICKTIASAPMSSIEIFSVAYALPL
ncbi:MAG: hypothetical protein H6657_18005 [Ardenticatenaceae bacterium]|nr:hypothetical protein [Ardenticatenaceae bacterium]